MDARYRHPEALVSTQWLAEHLDEPGGRVFECTTYLLYRPEGDNTPYDVGSGRPDFDAGKLIRDLFFNTGYVDLLREQYASQGLYWLDVHSYGPIVTMSTKKIRTCLANLHAILRGQNPITLRAVTASPASIRSAIDPTILPFRRK